MPLKEDTMRLTADMITKAKETADRLLHDWAYDYDCVGVRVQGEPFELGPIDHVSHIWVDGDDTGEELPGICAQDVHTLERYNDPVRYGVYPGDHVAIIAGDLDSWGVDPGEIIIRNAVVIDILS